MGRTISGILRTPLLVAALALPVFAPAPAEAKRVSMALDFGDDVLLAGDETLSIRARCIANDGGFDRIRVYAVTSSDAILRGLGAYVGNGSYLTAATPEANSQMSAVNAPTGQEYAGWIIDGGSYVLRLATRSGYAIAMETSALTLNLGAKDCHVSVDIEKIKGFKQAK